MTCLRAAPPSQRSGDVWCDEEGCEFRRVTRKRAFGIDAASFEAECLLQLDEDVRTPQDTCRHNVIYARLDEDFKVFVRCVSCDKEITDNDRVGRNYEYDIDYNVWVAARRTRGTAAEEFENLRRLGPKYSRAQADQIKHLEWHLDRGDVVCDCGKGGVT